MQKTADPSPPTEEEPVEGLYSIAPSRVSSMSRTPCNVAVDFIAPPNGKLRFRWNMGLWSTYV